MKHKQLYFIEIDSNDNVFVHNQPNVVYIINSWIYNSNIFVHVLIITMTIINDCYYYIHKIDTNNS